MENNQHIQSSNVSSYLDLLTTSFTDFLRQQGSSEKTRRNYKSDTRHFFSWFTFTLESTSGLTIQSPDQLVNLVTPNTIENYKQYLVANKVPVSTINRRLSTLRSFFACCLYQGWVSTNPTVTLKSIKTAQSNRKLQPEKLLELFKRDLTLEGASKATVKNYVSDVRQFLDWLGKTRQF